MYRRDMKCAEVVGIDHRGQDVLCGKDVGYALVSHDFSNRVLVEARRECSACGRPSLNEEAMLWERQPSASSYRGPTLHQMALVELERLRSEARAAQ